MPTSLERPVFILSPPRSGSTLLYKVLSEAPDAWTTKRESHLLIETIPGLHPRDRGWDSNRLLAADAQPHIVDELTRRLIARMSDRDGRAPSAGDRPTLLEKTPKNCLRVPFFAAAYPDARFIYIHREPVETINSMIEGWRVPPPKFKTYPDLPGWAGPTWSFLLIPGWQELNSRGVPEIAARQWATATQLLLEDCTALPEDRWYVADFRHLVAEPAKEIGRICDFLGWSYDRPLTAPLPLSGSQISAPDPGKWRRNADELEAVLPLTQTAADLARSALATRRV